MATSNCECFILVGKKEMTTKPQLCLHFSQLLRSLLSSFFVFLSLSSGLKVSNGSLHLEIFQFLNNLWRAKQEVPKQNTSLTYNTPSCSTSRKFCNTSGLPKCPVCLPFGEF